MRDLTADFFVSLDGFASDAEGGQDWIRGFGGPQMGAFVHEVLSKPHVMIVGRKTYEVLSGYWPKAKEAESLPMNSLPKLVFSKSLREPLGWNNARLVKGDLAQEILALKEQAGPPLRSIGSLALVRSMVKLGLVDRLRMLVFPAILGKNGREPIFGSFEQLRVELVAQSVLDSNTLLLEYRPASREPS